MGDWKILDTGGTAIDLETNYLIKVKQALGVGMPPINNVVTNYALADGGKFQRSTALPREFILECIVPFPAPTTKAVHHAAKQAMINLIKRDRQTTEGPVTVRYTGATADVQIEAYYVSGLEGGQITGNVENFQMQFIAPDPFWKETSQNNTALTPGTAISANHAIRTTGGGSWANFGTGGGSTVNWVQAIAEDDDNIYIGGSFTTWDSGTVNNIVRFDKAGQTYHALGSGGTVGVNNTVTHLAIDSGGTVYIGGSFTAAGTASISKITNYHETPDDFTDFGYSGNNITALAIAANDDCYFTTIIATMKYWDGSTINTVSSGGTISSARSMAIDTNNVMTLGGDWSISGPTGTTTDYLVKYDIDSDTWADMASAQNAVWDIALGNDATTVYVGCLSPTGSSVDGGIQKWNGSSLRTLGITPDGGTAVERGIYSIVYDNDNNRLYAGGNHTDIDGDSTFAILAQYNLTTGAWEQTEVNIAAGISTIYAINHYDPDDSICFGYYNPAGAPSVTIPKTAAVSNTGSATATPSIQILGPGAIVKIENVTTGAKLKFTGLTLASGETMTVDLTPGSKSISTTLRTDLMSYLTSDSNLSTFDLRPGSNTISLQTDSTVAGTISWYDTHWSIYGAQ